MAPLQISFVRRGYSPSGGAEAYLKRLAAGLTSGGHEAHLFTTNEWPKAEWPFGPVTQLPGKTPTKFADEVERARAASHADVTMSLERIWQCDVYRAGDGVHRAWLERRGRFESALRKLGASLNRKHAAILRLEESLFGERNAGYVIANSEMVKREIVELYRYPEERIAVIPNGIPAEEFRFSPEQRARARLALGLNPETLAVLFVGSGWERKGLRFALAAVEACHDPRMELLIAGRGSPSRYRSSAATFLGEVIDLSQLYAAADMFLLPTIYDPFSNASLEALATGLPVITTRANGASEIMEGGRNGSLIDHPGDVSAIESALRFWSNESRRAQARADNAELAKRYDISVNVERTLEILLQEASASSTVGKMRKT